MTIKVKKTAENSGHQHEIEGKDKLATTHIITDRERDMKMRSKVPKKMKLYAKRITLLLEFD